MRQLFSLQMVALLIATFFFQNSIMMTAPVVANFCASLGGSAVMMGLAGSLGGLSALVCRPFLGTLIDKGSWKRLGMAGLFCMGAGAALCAGAPGVWTLLTGRVLLGTGYSVSSGTLSTWVVASLPPDRIGQGMGLYGMVQAAAQAFSPAFGLYVADAVNYRATCAVAAGLALLSTLLVTLLRSPAAAAPARTQPDSGGGKQLILPELLPIALIAFLFCVPYSGTSAFLATVAKDRMLPFNVGSFFTIYAVFLLLARMLLSRTMDRIPFRRFVLLSVPFGVGSMLSLHWMSSRWLMLTGALFLTFSYGMIQPVCQAACVRAVSPYRRGLANCTYYIGLDCGLSLGPLFCGVLYQFVGEHGLFMALAAFPLLSWAVLAAAHRKLKALKL